MGLKALTINQNVIELLEKYGIELPVAIPDVKIGLTFDGEDLKIRVEYFEEQLEAVEEYIGEMSKTDMELFSLQLLLAAKKVQSKYEKELNELKAKVM